MSSQSILVLGAGELGTAVLEALTTHSQHAILQPKITVLLRPSSIQTTDPVKRAQISHLSDLGILLEAADVEADTVANLAAIFRRHHTVISCTGMYAPPGTQVKLTRAALEAGVARYFPWQYGLDYDAIGAGSAQDLFDEQLEVRSLLRNSSSPASAGEDAGKGGQGVDWVIVSTGLFTSFLLVPGFGPVDRGARVLRALGSWDTAVSVTTPRDVGRMVAEIVYEPRGIARQVVYVAGDTVTYGRVAELVQARFSGEAWTREVWSREVLRARAEAEPEDGMVKYQNVFAAGKGVAFDTKRTLNYERGIALEDLETYLRNIED